MSRLRYFPLTLANPFTCPSSPTYQAPPFERIRDADYQPAIEEGMRLQLNENGLKETVTEK